MGGGGQRYKGKGHDVGADKRRTEYSAPPNNVSPLPLPLSPPSPSCTLLDALQRVKKRENAMTDLQHVLADFDVRPFSHVLPSLDKALVTTADLLTLDVAQVAKRAQLQ
jgi:hypothetical protein